jgi:hypothetical protein
MMSKPVRGALPREIEPGVMYRAPSGRLCSMDPKHTKGNETYFSMLYALPDGRPAPSWSTDGFCMSKFNWYLLRRVG